MKQRLYETPTARLIPIEAEQLLAESIPVEDKDTDQMLSKEISFDKWDLEDFDE